MRKFSLRTTAVFSRIAILSSLILWHVQILSLLLFNDTDEWKYTIMLPKSASF